MSQPSWLKAFCSNSPEGDTAGVESGTLSPSAPRPRADGAYRVLIKKKNFGTFAVVCAREAGAKGTVAPNGARSAAAVRAALPRESSLALHHRVRAALCVVLGAAVSFIVLF